MQTEFHGHTPMGTQRKHHCKVPGDPPSTATNPQPSRRSNLPRPSPGNGAELGSVLAGSLQILPKGNSDLSHHMSTQNKGKKPWSLLCLAAYTSLRTTPSPTTHQEHVEHPGPPQAGLPQHHQKNQQTEGGTQDKRSKSSMSLSSILVGNQPWGTLNLNSSPQPAVEQQNWIHLKLQTGIYGALIPFFC